LNLTGIETVTLTTGGNNVIDLSNSSGITKLGVTQNIQTITGYQDETAIDITGDAATLKVTGKDTSGTADTLTVLRDLAADSDGTATVEASGFETLALKIEDTEATSASNKVTWTISKVDAPKVVVTEGADDTGDAAVDLGTLSKNVTSVDTTAVQAAQALVASSG
jgi:hypothetical protein